MPESIADGRPRHSVGARTLLALGAAVLALDGIWLAGWISDLHLAAGHAAIIALAIADTVRRWRREKRLQTRRRATDRRYAVMAEAASDWLWETDAKHRFRYVSDRFPEITGVPAATILGRTRWSLGQGGEDDPQWAAHRAQMEAHSPIRDFVYRLSLPDNERDVWIRVSGKPVFLPSGQFDGYVGVASDISERVLAKQALAEHQRFVSTLLANVPGMAYRAEADPDGALMFASQGAMALTGIPPQNLIVGGHSAYRDLIHHDDRARVSAAIAQALADRTPFRITYRIRDAQGQEKWVWEQGTGVYDPAGLVSSVEGLVTDISEQKAGEEALSRVRAYLKSVIDSMPSVLVGVDTDGRLVDWNEHAARMSGFSWQQARGRDFVEVFTQLTHRQSQIRKAIRERRTYKSQRFTVPLGDARHHLEVMVYPLVADDTLSAVIRLDDVTARVKTEEMMVQTEKMLSVGGLAAGMAHEINNPLGAILQGTQAIRQRLMADNRRNAEAALAADVKLDHLRDYLNRRDIPNLIEQVRDAGARAARIVADMLSFSRRAEAEPQPARVNDMINTAVRLASNDYLLRTRHDFDKVSIVREFDPELSVISCVRTEIEQVLLNLIKNAAQSMLSANTENPTLTLRTRHELGYAVIEIIDNGPGMSADVRKRVFEPFFTTKDVGAGTGLGLSVSYFIVTEQHRGSLTVTSQPGEGARFTMLLPLEDE